MIGRLLGEIVDVSEDGSVLVDVGGVGYEVFTPPGAGVRIGETKMLHIHTHVREDALTLYGFETSDDRAAFRALIGVNSIGPKLARSILGRLDARSLTQAIELEDRPALKGIPGVGKKTIERILLDLKGKLRPLGSVAGPAVINRRAPAVPEGPLGTVVGALVQMGYKRAEAERAVGSIEDGESKPVESLLREALGALS